jgi:hypothetical protein
MIEKLLEGLPAAFRPFVPAVQKMLPIWMEKLKFRPTVLALKDAEDAQTVMNNFASCAASYGISGCGEVRRVDLEIDGKPITVFILGDVAFA